MKITLKPDKYVVAVSGGVDSVVLLDLLNRDTDIEVVVAHFNHGIRADTDKDEEFVVNLAKKYNLPFAVGKGNLGVNASEDLARQARYVFLAEVKDDFEASGIVTAHHQDDLIETTLINLLRGTHSRGVSAIAQNKNILRPMLNTPKKDILAYAKRRNLVWREDESNQNTKYLRNYLRLKVLPGLSISQRQSLLENIQLISQKRSEIDQLLSLTSHALNNSGSINRAKFTALPSDMGTELIAHWLRQLGYRQFDKKILDRLVVAIKTSRAGTSHPVYKGLNLVI